MTAESIEITLLGKAYRVACKPEERDGLLTAVAFVADRLNDLAAKTNASGEKLAVMTALNIAHEFLLQQRGDGFDMPGVKRRIDLVNARLDGILSQQEKLF
jgi:cell division protein ZapA